MLLVTDQILWIVVLAFLCYFLFSVFLWVLVWFVWVGFKKREKEEEEEIEVVLGEGGVNAWLRGREGSNSREEITREPPFSFP